MRLDEFYRRQAERFSALAEQCVDPEIRAKVLTLAREYEELIRAGRLRVVQSEKPQTAA